MIKRIFTSPYYTLSILDRIIYAGIIIGIILVGAAIMWVITILIDKIKKRH